MFGYLVLMLVISLIAYVYRLDYMCSESRGMCCIGIRIIERALRRNDWSESSMNISHHNEHGVA